jgi:hypothetical protein
MASTLLLSNTRIVGGGTPTASDDTLAVGGGTLMVGNDTLAVGSAIAYMTR